MHTLKENCPKIGIVIPSKELSSQSAYENFGISPLEYFIRRFVPDFPGSFAAVYHHTILRSERTPNNEPLFEKGESRYINSTPFPDPFSILNMLAKYTKNAELYTAVLVSPQMQTASLAQQVAAIADLSKGRFVLGLGVGWNKQEYAALGKSNVYKTRGQVLNQQIPVLKHLLTGKTFTGQVGNEEIFDQMAINPAAKYNIPIWIGGQSKAARLRAAKFGNGWMPLGDIDQFIKQLPLLYQYLDDFKKNSEDFQTMGRIALGKTPPDQWVDSYISWKKTGVTHLALTTTGNEDEFNQKGIKADPYHHLHLQVEFLKLTSWLRNPSSTFNNLFKSERRQKQLVLPDNLKNLSHFELHTNMKIEYIIKFLESKGKFIKINIAQQTIKNKGDGNSFISDTIGLIGPNNNRVLFFRSKNDRILVLYNSEIDLGFGIWR